MQLEEEEPLVFVDVTELGEFARITNQQVERILSANAFSACALFLLSTAEEVRVLIIPVKEFIVQLGTYILPVHVFLTLTDETGKQLIAQMYQEGMVRGSLP